MQGQQSIPRFIPGRRRERTEVVDRTRPFQIVGWGDYGRNDYYNNNNNSSCNSKEHQQHRRRRRRRRHGNRVIVMSNANVECSSSSIYRVFSRDDQDVHHTYDERFEESAAPDLSWDESSSSDCTLRPCLKVSTAEDSLKYSYYPDNGGSVSAVGVESLVYRVDFSTQTVYYHDLTVQEVRGPRNEKEPGRVHGISLRSDPWKVIVSSVPLKNVSTSCKQRKECILRWSRLTRENVWLQFCKEKKQEEEKRLYQEFRLAEQDLNDVTGIVGDEMDEKRALELEETLDAMEELW